MTIPAAAYYFLDGIPPEFVDDGCSSAPDWNFGWACRIHDWWYCTRAHPEGQMTDAWRAAGDAIIKHMIRSTMPRWLRWVGGVYYVALRALGGHSFDTCGPQPKGAMPFQRVMGWCRHGLPQPDWMLEANSGDHPQNA